MSCSGRAGSHGLSFLDAFVKDSDTPSLSGSAGFAISSSVPVVWWRRHGLVLHVRKSDSDDWRRAGPSVANSRQVRASERFQRSRNRPASRTLAELAACQPRPVVRCWLGLGLLSALGERTKIPAAIRQVPARYSWLFVAPSGAWIEENDLGHEVIEPEAYVLEAALQLKEKHGGEVVAPCASPKRVSSAIRGALAKSADRAIHVEEVQGNSVTTSCLVRVKVITQLGKMTTLIELGAGFPRGREESGEGLGTVSGNVVGRDSQDTPTRLAKPEGGRERPMRGQRAG